MKSPLKTDTHYYYQTAGWRVYPNSGQVQRGNEALRLGPIPMQVLVVLLGKQGQVVTRNELFDQVWKNQVVSDDALTRCISDLRAMLGHHSTDSPLIQTLPKRGYCWLPAVDVLELTSLPPDLKPELKPELSAAGAIHDEPQSVQQAATESESLAVQANPALASPPQAALASGALQPTNWLTNCFSNWRQMLAWALLSLVLLFAMAVASVWWLRSYKQVNYVGVAILASQINRPELSGLARELDQQLKQHVLASQRLRYLSQRALHRQSSTQASDLLTQFASKWQIESQLYQHDQVLDLSLSLVDSRTELVLFEKSRRFRLTPSAAFATDELKALAVFSQEFIGEVEKLLLTPLAD